MFEKVIAGCADKGEISLTATERQLLAHNIFVQGQMWGFRRWALQRNYTLEEYIEVQTQLILRGIQKSGNQPE